MERSFPDAATSVSMPAEELASLEEGLDNLTPNND